MLAGMSSTWEFLRSLMKTPGKRPTPATLPTFASAGLGALIHRVLEGVSRIRGSHGTSFRHCFRHCVVRLNIEKSARLNILNLVNGLRSHVCRCGLPG